MENPLLRTLLAGLLAWLALPAMAEAGVRLAPLARCYLAAGAGQAQPVDVRAQGFAPAAAVDVSLDGRVVASLAADATGTVHARVTAPDPGKGERGFTVEVRERGRDGARVRRRSRVALLDVRLSPADASPGSRVRWRGRGFLAPGPVFAHYLGPRGERRTVELARPRGRCGRFSTRRPQFPFRPGVGSWTVQIDQSADYTPAPGTPVVRVPIEVRRER